MAGPLTQPDFAQLEADDIFPAGACQSRSRKKSSGSFEIDLRLGLSRSGSGLSGVAMRVRAANAGGMIVCLFTGLPRHLGDAGELTQDQN
jgi:hypothetical protein